MIGRDDEGDRKHGRKIPMKAQHGKFSGTRGNFRVQKNEEGMLVILKFS